MSSKLDQSLGDIMKTRNASRRNNRQRPTNGVKAAGRAPAPVGGVRKVTKPVKATKPATSGSLDGESKVLVSMLPQDVNEKQIQEYFQQTIGNVKKVLISYGPNGKSRGVATIIFSKLDAAAQAAKAMDGVKVDGRPMKVEVILGAKDAPAPAAPKSLKDRISAPKQAAQPKPATVAKKATAAKPGKGKNVGRKGKAAGGRNRPKKTAEELDAEMMDYFEQEEPAKTGDATMENGGAVQAAGDTGMEDEIM